MKKLLIGVLTVVAGVARLSRADDLEPAVRTSSAAVSPTAVAPAAGPVPPATAPTAVTPKAPAAAARRPGAALASKPKALDHVDLSDIEISGDRELPNVMYVVPWKKPDLGEFAGRPPKSLLDELLAPVDRDVFRRQNRYFSALHPDAAVAPAAPATTPAAGAATTLPAGDEK